MVNVLKNTDISIHCSAWNEQQNQLANDLLQQIHFGPCDPSSNAQLRVYSAIDIDQNILSIYNLINSEDNLVVTFELRTSYNKTLATYAIAKAEYQLCQSIPCFNYNEFSTNNYGGISICWYLYLSNYLLVSYKIP